MRQAQNMRRRDFLALAGAGAAGVLGLSACSTGIDDAATLTNGEGSDVPVDVYDTKDISLSWWGNDPRHQYTLEGVRLFEQKHPGIHVEPAYSVWNGYERRYNIRMLSGNEADVMQVNYAWLQRYSPDGEGYYDINALTEVIDLSNFGRDDLACGMREGRLNALPIAYNTTALFYSKDIYDSYGLGIPATWDDLFNAADAMRADGVFPQGTIYKQLSLVANAWHEQSSGARLFTEDGSYVGSEEDVGQILGFAIDLIEHGVIPAPKDFDAMGFVGGKDAGVMCWASDSLRYVEGEDGQGPDAVMGPYLRRSSGGASASTAGAASADRWYVKPATLYAMSAKTVSPDEAGTLMDFLLNDPDFAKLQGTEKGVPISKAAVKALRDAGMLKGVEWEAGQYIHDNRDQMDMINPMLEDADVQDAFEDAVNRLLYSDATLAQMAGETNDAFARVAADRP